MEPYHIFLIFIVVSSTFKESVTAYRTDIDEANEATFCQHRKHLTFKPQSTCCNGEVIKPALDIFSHKEACRSSTSSLSSVEEVSWAIYSCALAKINTDKTKVTMKDFAKLIYANYPQAIIDKIETKIEPYSSLEASFTQYDRLEKLRVTYYDIERQVCEDQETTTIGQIEMCSSWLEENYRSGMCCSKAYPYDLKYQTVFDADTLSSSATAQCSSILHAKLRSLNATETMQNSLAEICGVVCLFSRSYRDIIPYIFDSNALYNFNLTWFFTNYQKLLVPPGFPSRNDELLTYLQENFNMNKTVEAMEDFKFADVVGGNSYTPRPVHLMTWVHQGNPEYNETFKIEFMRHGFHKGILHVPIMCSTFHQLVSLVEDFYYKDCKPIAVTEGSLPVVEEPVTAAEEPVTAAEEPEVSQETPAPS